MAAGITFKLGGVLDPTFKGAMAESVAEAKAAAAAQAAAYQKSAIALERQIVLAKKEGFSYVETTAALRALNAERTKLMLMPHGITEAGIISTVTSSQRGNLSKDAAIESGAAVDVSMLGLYKARRAAHAADEAEIARYETALAEGGRRTVATLGSANAAEEAAWAVKFAEAKARVAARKQLEKEGIDWALTQKAAQGAIWTEQSVAAGKMLARFEQERIAAKAASAEMKAQQIVAAETIIASAAGGGGGAHGHAGMTGIIRESLVIMREVAMGRGGPRVAGSVTLLAQYLGVLKLAVKSTAAEQVIAAAAAQKLNVQMAAQALLAAGTTKETELLAASQVQAAVTTEALKDEELALATAQISLNPIFFIAIAAVVALAATVGYLAYAHHKAAVAAKNLADALNPLKKKYTELAAEQDKAAKAAKENADWIEDLNKKHISESDQIERKIKLLKEEAAARRRVMEARGASDAELQALDVANLQVEKAKLKVQQERLKTENDTAQAAEKAAGKAAIAGATMTDEKGRVINAEQAQKRASKMGEILDEAQDQTEKSRMMLAADKLKKQFGGDHVITLVEDLMHSLSSHKGETVDQYQARIGQNLAVPVKVGGKDYGEMTVAWLQKIPLSFQSL